MGLRDEIDDELRRVAQSAPWNIETQVTGQTVEGSAERILAETVIPLLNAHREALLTLASAIDELRAGR